VDVDVDVVVDVVGLFRIHITPLSLGLRSVPESEVRGFRGERGWG
jgi:hypothetical protein